MWDELYKKILHSTIHLNHDKTMKIKISSKVILEINNFEEASLYLYGLLWENNYSSTHQRKQPNKQT
jgi:hypothetical protein